MKTFTANEAKTNFGELLLNTQREPVSVTKNGKPAAVVLSQQDYETMANAAVIAASYERFPPDQAVALRRIISNSEEKMANGRFIAFNGALDEAMKEFEAR